VPAARTGAASAITASSFVQFADAGTKARSIDDDCELIRRPRQGKESQLYWGYQQFVRCNAPVRSGAQSHVAGKPTSIRTLQRDGIARERPHQVR
jgi:hypothetical protein